ncbi:MAG: hypothetical protein WC675_02635 [Patescibacteria group bacterium]|jgi:dihydroorotate dehydrogenase electron transfer subunit
MSASKVVDMAVVSSVTQIAQGIVKAALCCPRIAARVKPGQFVTIEPGIPSANCRRPFTVYSRRDDVIDLVIQDAGPNTRAYAGWKAGQDVEILGPIGQGIIIDPAIECFLMIAGGCGLASMHFPAREINEQTSARVIVGCGFRNRAQVFGQADFERIGATFNYVTQAEDSKTAVDLLREILSRDGLPSSDKVQIITCGPKPMMKQVALLAQEAGVSCLAFIEQVMGCGGIYACKSCAVPMLSGFPKYVCKDGPVFPAEEVNWYELT